MKLLHALFLAALPVLPAQARLNVVATTPDLAAIAREIGGDRVEIVTLARPTEDPHFVEAKPSFIVKMNRADALLEGGAELEIGWLGPLLSGARNPKLAEGSPGRISCSRGIALLEAPSSLDRSQGDLHAHGNPHYSSDPLNGRTIARNVTDAFSRLEPASAAHFQANLKRFEERLQARLAEWEQSLKPWQGRHIVTYHNYWLYFASRFGLKMDVFLEPKPGLPPSASHLTQVVGRMKTEGLKVILVQPYVNRKTAETVAGLAGGVVVDAAAFPGGSQATESYLDWIGSVVQALVKALADTSR